LRLFAKDITFFLSLAVIDYTSFLFSNVPTTTYYAILFLDSTVFTQLWKTNQR